MIEGSVYLQVKQRGLNRRELCADGRELIPHFSVENRDVRYISSTTDSLLLMAQQELLIIP